MKKTKLILLLLLTLCSVCLFATACENTNKEKLPDPQNLRIEGTDLVWDEVENASGYVVYIEKKEYETKDNFYDLSYINIEKSYVIEVLAIGDGIRFSHSDWSCFTYTYKKEIPTQGLQYNLTEVNGFGGYEVSRGSANIAGRVVIPDYYKGLPVIKIADRFLDLSSLNNNPPVGGYNKKTTSVRLPAYLLEIGKDAFHACTALTELKLPEGLKIIGEHAFFRLELENIKLPSTIEEIKDSAFSAMPITSIEIPQNVKSIGTFAFCECTNLKKVIIPENITHISDFMFIHCTSLSEIQFPEKIEYFGRGVVEDTAWFNNQLEGFVTVNEKFLLGYNGIIPNGGVIESLPQGITHIAGNAFHNNLNLVAISIPDGVTIGIGAFSGCTNLQKVNLPHGIQSILNLTFAECTSLTSIVIPEGVTLITSSAFRSCVHLKIFLPSTLKKITEGLDVESIYYNGSKSEWDNNVEKRFNIDSTVYFFVSDIDDALEDGNYWYYDDEGKPVIYVKKTA